MKRAQATTVAAVACALMSAEAVALTSASPSPRPNPSATPNATTPGTTYSATWNSTDQHNPAPEWFQDAKFGVYWHFGAFTTPQYYDEWYPRLMYQAGSDVNNHHTTVYGPVDQWGYENFLTGKNDASGKFTQFNPVLVANGGQFDPVAFIDIVAASGAKFAGPVGEHHDGFSMWDSQVNPWNSVRLGPKLDLLKIWAEQVRAHDMKLIVTLHTAYNTNGYYQYVPKKTNVTLQQLFGQLPKAQSDQLWLEKEKEVVDHVQPDIIWHDWELMLIDEEKRLEFLAYYFNAAIGWGKEVVTTFKFTEDTGFSTTSAVGDYERGGPAGLSYPYWLTDDAVSGATWSYTNGMTYYSSIQMIHSLLDRISKNGNMLLDISPMANGVIPAAQQSILKDIGTYLSRYGEAVYSTRAWTVYGEGPTKAGGGSFTAPILGTSKDLRFTRTKAGDILYATILGWPGNSLVSIASLRSGVNLSGLISIQLLGNTAGTYLNISSSKWKQNSGSLDINLPAQPATSVAYVLKLTFNGTIPKPAGT